MSEPLYSLLTRIAIALEAQAEPDDDTLTVPLSEFAGFPWSTIGATIVQRDADGVSVIRTANGKMAKRRSNDKFGTEVWFSYSDGKDTKGENRYHKVVEFRNVAPPEPLGRKTEQAVKAATPPAATEPSKPAAPAAGEPRFTSPFMVPILAHWKALALEAAQLGQADIQSRFIMQPSMAVPECQHRTDELEQFVAGLRMAKTVHAPEQLVALKAPPDLQLAHEWLAQAPRVSADNRAQLMEELNAQVKKFPAFKVDMSKLSAQARMDAFAEFVKGQMVPA